MRALIPLLLLATATAAEPLSLDQAVAQALAGNPEADVAASRVAGAVARVKAANAAFLPVLRLAGTYTITDQPALAFMGLINHQAYGPTINPNDPPTVDNLNLSAMIQVPIFHLDSYQGRRAAQAGTATATEAQEATRHALALATAQTFIQVHRVGDLVAAAQAGVTAYATNRIAAQARFDAGKLLKSELMDVESRLAEAKGELIKAQGGLELSGQMLGQVLGTGGTVTDLAPLADLPLPDETTKPQRPELLAALSQENAAAIAIRQVRAGRAPQLDGFAGYGYDRGFKQDGDRGSWQAGVMVSVNAFDGGRISAGVEQAMAQHTQAVAERRKLELELFRQVAAARVGLRTASERILVAQSAVEAASEAERVMTSRFAEGAVTTSELAISESGLIRARIMLADARADRRLALVNLRHALGLPIVTK